MLEERCSRNSSTAREMSHAQLFDTELSVDVRSYIDAQSQHGIDRAETSSRRLNDERFATERTIASDGGSSAGYNACSDTQPGRKPIARTSDAVCEEATDYIAGILFPSSESIPDLLRLLLLTPQFEPTFRIR